jgi:DNA-binding MarR family transcriptional regulator
MPAKKHARADLVRELASAFAASGRRVTAVTDAILRDHELTGPLGGLIWELDPDLDPPAMKDLAVALYCDRSNVTALVEKLVRRGLAERHEDPEDRRSKVVVLTPAGVEMRVSIMRQLVGDPAFAGLSDQDCLALVTLLRRISPQEQDQFSKTGG